MRRLERAGGAVLLEALMTVALLALLVTFFIQGVAASLSGHKRVLETFAGAQHLANLLFDLHADETGAWFGGLREGSVSGGATSLQPYTYSVGSRLFGQTKKPWGEKNSYVDYEVRLAWRDGREFLLGRTLIRQEIAESPQARGVP